jgi:alkaline phosphatase D
MPIRRRELLKGLSGLAAYASLPWTPGCADEDGHPGDTTGFSHGIASGDPLSDAVILWTRFKPEHAGPVTVHWELAEDPEFTNIVMDGALETSAERDYTVKVDAHGLEAAATYYYRFEVDSGFSPIGRTRTAPSGSVDRVRFAVVSCASYAHGYFHAYRAISKRLDLDAIIHLGDYIYEYGTNEYGTVRSYEPSHEALTLEDYRLRYAQYRRDPDLLAAHQQFPIIAVWDDHEIANNAWIGGAENHNPDKGEGPFAARKAAATRAYFEWMPIREAPDDRLFRQFNYGDLVDLIMLDTRSWGRQEQVTGADVPGFNDAQRTLLGADQEQWFSDAMQRSAARWRLLGQQVMVGPLPTYFNTDDWTGYPAARQRLLQLLGDLSNKDTVVLTGDVHSSWAMNLVLDASKYDAATGRGAVAVEFIAPGITSPGTDRASAESLQPMLLDVPHVKYVNLWQRGYMLLDVNTERVHADWYLFDAIEDPDYAVEMFAAACATYAGEHCVRVESKPVEAPAAVAVAAPAPDERQKHAG